VENLDGETAKGVVFVDSSSSFVVVGRQYAFAKFGFAMSAGHHPMLTKH
jgi:hypothetical protein